MLKLKIVTKVMLMIDLDIQDHLLLAKQEMLVILNLIKVVFEKYMWTFSDEQAGLKTIRSSYLGRQNF